MDKHEYRVKTEQMLEYMRQKSYKQAMDIADMIDWRKVKNVSMLCAVSEIYEVNKEYQKSRDILFLAYDRSPDSRKIIYRLGTLALKLGEVKEAVDCYDEFIALAPKDPNQYVFKYKILKSQNASLEEQIEALEEFKKVEYVEKWAFELAKLYQSAGMTAECIEECDDLILWFSEGKYVYKAMELKMQYKALTPLQQEKYNLRFAKQEPVKEEPVVVEEVVKEQPVIAETAEEAVVEELVMEEAVARESAMEEAVAEESETVETQQVMQEQVDAVEGLEMEETMEEKKEAPTLSIEEMLQEWESKQKENAEMIRAEIEKVEQEKAQDEPVEEVQEEAESILSDDIRQLMEALETESADIEAQKIKQEEEPEVPEEEKPLIQKVAEQLAAMDIKEAITSAIPVAPVTPAAPVAPTVPVEPLPTVKMPEVELTETEELAQVASHALEIEEPVEEAGGIKLGDTQSMAAVAKALKNNVELEVPEEEEEEAYEETERTPYDTGFIVKGRYDLEAQSEIGLKAGLTEEQKKLFSYFVPVHGMSEQLVEVLQNDKKCKSRYGTSRIGNLVIIGRKGSGKTVLAVDVVKAIQKSRKLKQGKVGIVTAESLNKKDVTNILEKLHGGAIIIEKASRLNRRTIETLCEVMEGQTGELLVVLEDERKPMDKLLAAYPQFGKKFTSRLEVPVFINDELVTFGQTYAKENGYKIDEMGILALYSRIDILQREERVVTVADVKEILDDAIENSQKASFKKLVKKFMGKNTDESDRILLREEDFK